MAAGAHTQWRQIFAVFERWQTARTDDRDAVLTHVREESPELYPHLVGMIEADAVAQERGFMDEDALSALAPAAPTTWAGVRLGAWVLREPIGVGGMGQVWLATRADQLYTGRAAVKLMHSADASVEANERFAREAEFLGRVAHPCIAQLYDAGLTPDGTRYLVLEHVKGKALDQSSDDAQLTVEDRVRLFLQVCDAVAYAHVQRVVHRDLKPSNILVTPDGHAKLLDFGVAKMMSDASSDIELTQLGSRWFTPEYAAPEQIEGNTITTATDVYSLGVVLFRLLSGAKPNDEVRSLTDAVRHVASPLRTMRAALDRADGGTIARSRSTTLAKLHHELGGDLATIVAKCLKFEPSERYDTAQALGDDLRRCLAREPIRARPDSWSYRARKFVERNRVQAVAAGVVSVAVLVGFAMTWWQWQSAVQEARRTEAALSVVTGVFRQLEPDRTGIGQVSVTELMREAWQQAHEKLEGDPELEAKIARPIGVMLVTAEHMDAAREPLTVAHDYLRRAGRTHTQEYLEVLVNLASVEAWFVELDTAAAYCHEVLRIAVEMNDPTLAEPAFARIQLGLIAKRYGRMEEAERWLKDAVEGARTNPAGPQVALHLATHRLNSLERELGRTPTVVTPRDTGTRSRGDVVIERMSSTSELVETGRFHEAIEPIRREIAQLEGMFGATSDRAINGYVWLSKSLFHDGRIADSDAAIAEAVRRARDTAAPDNRHMLGLFRASHLMRSGHVADAGTLILSARDFFDRKQLPEAARAHALYGELLLRTGKTELAQQALTDAVDAQGASAARCAGQSGCFTLLLRAVATDLATNPSAAAAHYEDARIRTLATLADGHPDRARVSLMTDYATWRAAPSQTARNELVNSIQRYQRALATRADSDQISVFMKRLTVDTKPAAAQTNLLTLLNY